MAHGCDCDNKNMPLIETADERGAGCPRNLQWQKRSHQFALSTLHIQFQLSSFLGQERLILVVLCAGGCWLMSCCHDFYQRKKTCHTWEGFAWIANLRSDHSCHRHAHATWIFLITLINASPDLPISLKFFRPVEAPTQYICTYIHDIYVYIYT